MYIYIYIYIYNVCIYIYIYIIEVLAGRGPAALAADLVNGGGPG